MRLSHGITMYETITWDVHAWRQQLSAPAGVHAFSCALIHAHYNTGITLASRVHACMPHAVHSLIQAPTTLTLPETLEPPFLQPTVRRYHYWCVHASLLSIQAPGTPTTPNHPHRLSTTCAHRSTRASRFRPRSLRASQFPYPSTPSVTR